MKQKNIFLTVFVLGGLLLCAPAHSAGFAAIKTVPVEHNGRVKPFDAFARQTLKTLANADRWEKKPAYLVLLDALSQKEKIKDWALIRVDYTELIQYLNLPAGKHFFSYSELASTKSKVEFLTQTAQSKRQKDERPSMLEQKAESLYGQLVTFEHLESGELIAVIPQGSGREWASAFASGSPLAKNFRELLELYKNGREKEFKLKSAEYLAALQTDFPDTPIAKTRLEVLYFDIDPFQKASLFYFLAFLFLSVFSKGKLSAPAGHLCLLLALLFHTFGIAARVGVLERPPVSNMFESMIFMNWALMIFALIFSMIKKNWAAVSIGCLISGLVMVYSHLLPIDKSLDVLVPVLRSNYWLSIHVMTVVSSYGAFGLAMGLGHRHLILSYFKKLNKKTAASSGALINRVIQLGVILIGVGTFLGGVWANESWGRFWGWDPKETWAFITFLSYLFVIHLRFLKKLSDFYLALASIIGFFVVLMTWYGVNFVLGRGLHSYGQGQGGMQWVVYYVAIEIVFVGFVLSNKKRFKS